MSQMVLSDFYNKMFADLWNIGDKLFKNGPSKTCGRQPLRNVKEYESFK